MLNKIPVSSKNYQSIVKSKIAQIESYLNEDNVSVGEDEVPLKVVCDCYAKRFNEQAKAMKEYTLHFCEFPYFLIDMEICMSDSNKLFLRCKYVLQEALDYSIRRIGNINDWIGEMVEGPESPIKKRLLTDPKLGEIFDFMQLYKRFNESTFCIFSNECFKIYLSGKGIVIECNNSDTKVFSISIDRDMNYEYETDFTEVARFLTDNMSKILLGVVVKISDCPEFIQKELTDIRQNADKL